MNVASLDLCRELYELSDEVWRPVIGLEDKFEVSDYGRIRSIYQHGLTNGRVRKLSFNTNGYASISYTDDYGKKRNLWVHQAVARAFHPNPLRKPVVNHKDSNRLHNCAHNLEWATVAEEHCTKQKHIACIVTHSSPTAARINKEQGWEVLGINKIPC